MTRPANRPAGESERAWNTGIDRSVVGGRQTDEWRISLGISRSEVRAWLASRGIDLPPKGRLPRSAIEGFIKAHPERFTP